MQQHLYRNKAVYRGSGGGGGLVTKSCPILCDHRDRLPGSSVHEILQARILEWVAMPSSRGSSPPRDQIHISCGYCIAGGFFTAEQPGSPGFSGKKVVIGK